MCSGDLSGFRCLFTSGRGSNLVQRIFSFYDSREVFQCFFYYFSFSSLLFPSYVSFNFSFFPFSSLPSCLLHIKCVAKCVFYKYLFPQVPSIGLMCFIWRQWDDCCRGMIVTNLYLLYHCTMKWKLNTLVCERCAKVIMREKGLLCMMSSTGRFVIQYCVSLGLK